MLDNTFSERIGVYSALFLKATFFHHYRKIRWQVTLRGAELGNTFIHSVATGLFSSG